MAAVRREFHEAFLMICVDTTPGQVPKMIGWRVLSDDNPSIHPGGRRAWLRAGLSRSGKTLAEAHAALLDSAKKDNIVWGWVMRLPSMESTVKPGDIIGGHRER